MVKSLKIALWVVVTIVVLAGVVLALRGEEDTWVCTSGGWAKHGNPATTVPATPCPPGSAAASVSYRECVETGNPVVVTQQPYRCAMPDGTYAIDESNPKLDRIRVAKPYAWERVSSPLLVEGNARGTWYFEASFPVELLDASGNSIAQVPAQAQGEWMTEDFVFFQTILEFPPQPPGSVGMLVLHKDNPSDLRQYDDEVRIPVRF